MRSRITLDDVNTPDTITTSTDKPIHSFLPPHRINIQDTSPANSNSTPVRPEDKWVMLNPPSTATSNQKRLVWPSHGRCTFNKAKTTKKDIITFCVM